MQASTSSNECYIPKIRRTLSMVSEMRIAVLWRKLNLLFRLNWQVGKLMCLNLYFLKKIKNGVARQSISTKKSKQPLKEKYCNM